MQMSVFEEGAPVFAHFTAQETSLSADEIHQHPRFVAALQRQASALVAAHAAQPHLGSVFSSQQRWLLAHATLADYFRRPPDQDGVLASALLQTVSRHRIASHNTADAFLKEMQKYGYLEIAPSSQDRRARPLRLGARARASVSAWLAMHLSTLDALDGGSRALRFEASPELLDIAQPFIADGLLGSSAIRAPDPSFSLFTWMNEGGVVMDWLFASIVHVVPGVSRIATTVASLESLSEHLRLSRSHLKRRLKAAQDAGYLGWHAPAGQSSMWVSNDFVSAYLRQQSAKLAIVDSAFARGLAAIPPR